MSLRTDDLEALWERLALAVDAAGDRNELFLGKLVLLLAERLGDRVAAEAAIAAALEDLQ